MRNNTISFVVLHYITTVRSTALDALHEIKWCYMHIYDNHIEKNTTDDKDLSH